MSAKSKTAVALAHRVDKLWKSVYRNREKLGEEYGSVGQVLSALERAENLLIGIANEEDRT